MYKLRKPSIVMLPCLVAAWMLLANAASAVAPGQEPRDNLELDGRGVPLGCDLIEGDIIICGDAVARGTYASNFWTNGIVPYEFDANVDATNRQRTIDAVAEWSGAADISFEAYDLAVHGWNHIRVRDSTFDEEPTNSSFVGMVGGEQILNMASWGAKFVIVHEFGHALGYWHEQSRPDRDTYVQIEWDRIITGYGHNFEKYGSAGVYGPYDFDSLMHYGQCSFSCCGAGPPLACQTTGCGADLSNCRTITVLPPYTEWQDKIGQRGGLSFWDAQVMSFLYPEDDWRFVGDPISVGIGTYFDPWFSLVMAYLYWAPEGGTIWVLEPGDWSIGTDILDRPMTIRSGNGTVNLLP